MKINMFHKMFHYGQSQYTKSHMFRAKAVRKLLKVLFCCDIPFEAEIDKSVWFCHEGFCTVINPKCKIGKNTLIQHRVTIGELSDNGPVPSIGNNVFIGAGAILLGGIYIGDNVKIGANALVIQSVPDNCTVVGNPAYIVKNNGVKVKKNNLTFN